MSKKEDVPTLVVPSGGEQSEQKDLPATFPACTRNDNTGSSHTSYPVLQAGHD